MTIRYETTRRDDRKTKGLEADTLPFSSRTVYISRGQLRLARAEVLMRVHELAVRRCIIGTLSRAGMGEDISRFC